MPIYEYTCAKCSTDFDHLAKSMADHNATVPCPECGSPKTTRRLSICAVKAENPADGSSSHAHNTTCGCGIPRGSCPMQR